MGRFFSSSLFAIVFCSLGAGQRTALQLPDTTTSQAQTPVVLPTGSRVEMALTRAVWAAKAKVGDPLYLQTIFPVTVGNRIAIPPGTYVGGTIDSIVAPTRKVSRAEIDVHFDQMIFANGYTVAISHAIQVQPGARIAPGGADAGATLSMVTVQVSRNNDILLDNGSQVEMTLEAPLALDAERVAQAVPLSHAPVPGQFKPATLCRNVPGTPGTLGTPGTPDTVIPGTPSTTIPSGIEGVPDTMIPGTAPTIIPGIPATPGYSGTLDTVCPAAPLVISSTPGGVTVKQTPTPYTKK